MKMYFSIQELCVTGDDIPIEVADKILTYHIEPMNEVRDILGYPITASQNSGYRPHDYEISKGRSGNSQHTFKGLGAVDWTCGDFEDNYEDLLETIIDNTDYTRMAVYNSFIHCDYKETSSGRRELFTSTSASVWTFDKHV